MVGPHAEFKEAEFLKQMGDEMEKLGAKRPTLRVEVIDELRQTGLGKMITIQALPPEPQRQNHTGE